MKYPEVDLSEVVETGTIQVFELEKFANSLGFYFNGSSFVRTKGLKNPLLRAVTVLSTNNMIRMYNTLDPRTWSVCGRYAFFNLVPLRNVPTYINEVSEQTVEVTDFETQGNLVPFYKADVDEAFANQSVVRLKIQISRKKGQTLAYVLSDKIEFYEESEGKDFADAVSLLKVEQQVEVA